MPGAILKLRFQNRRAMRIFQPIFFMNNEPIYEKELERWTDSQLKKLPLIKAPQSLRLRVMAQIRKQKVLRWWQKPLYYWSAFAKIVFTIVSVGVLVFCLWLNYYYGSRAVMDNSQMLSLYLIAGKLNLLIGFLKACVDAISAVWITFRWQLLIAGTVIAFFYCVCLGLATATFKLLTRK